MQTLTIHGIQDLHLEERPVPDLEAGEVLVRLGAGGICGSDLHYYFEGGVGDFRLREPMILGHEVAGVVSQVGAGVSQVKVGDSLAINPARPCGECPYCRSGHSNLCSNVRFFGSAARFPHVQGAFAEYFKVQESQCVKVPGDIPYPVVACAEPLAVSLHAVARAANLLGRKVLVTGCGPIGALIVAAAKLGGAAQIVVSDLHDEVLAVAEAMGASETINITQNPARLEALAANKGTFDVAIEASGNPKALETCIALTHPGGRIVQVGMLPPGPAAVMVNQLLSKELELLGTFRFHEEFAWAVDALVKGRIDVRPLLTAQYSFKEAAAAFNLAADRKKAMKISLVAG
ncbi:MAG: L-idonate 5-dehydrogenase [Thermaceae bacterium]|nr:L-idonate 5-dehydrogenase [Thermaceae bacterium]